MIAALLALLLAAPAHPLSSEAADAVRRARGYVADGNYAAARAALAEAEAMQRHPAILFSRAQVERFAGDCTAAIGYYRAFAELQSDPEDATEARHWIAYCEERVAASPPADVPEPSPPPPTRTPVVEPDAPIGKTAAAPANEANTTPPRRPQWRHDILGGALVGTGSAALAAGIGTLAAGVALRPEPESSDTLGDYRVAVDRARALQLSGSILIPLGAAVVLGGIIRYALVARKSKAAGARVSARTGAITRVEIRF